MLNYIFLITAIIVVFASLLYLFFWNKLVCFILSICLRIALWNQGESSVWISVGESTFCSALGFQALHLLAGSIHFSLVAGRILFKNARYHSSNQTIKVVKGQIVWRYWIRAPALEEDLQASSLGEHPAGQCSRVSAIIQICVA